MDIWAIANQKGGVGKTTMTLTLGGLLAGNGKRVLLVDLDPQASLTAYLQVDIQQCRQKLFHFFKKDNLTLSSVDVGAAITPTNYKNLDILPSSPTLATVDRFSSKKSGLGLVLNKMLNTLHSDYDYVLIDCPPGLSVLLVNAIACCSRLLIPVQTEPMALKGVERLLQTITMIQKNRQSPLPYSIVPVLFDPMVRTSHLMVEALRHQYPENLWHSAVPVDSELRDASLQGQLPSVFAPTSRAVFAYCALLDWIESKKIMSQEPTKESESA